MGAFQAVASGLGEAGEQLGTGIDNANKFGLQLRQQSHVENVDASHIALAQAMQKQQYDIAQQQHELMRQQLQANGWGPPRTVRNSDGSYAQQFDNPRMPPGQQTTTIPYNGIPPDSLEAKLGNYKQIKEQHPELDDTKAWEIATGMAGLYRTDPAGQLPEYMKYYKGLFENEGIKSVPVFGFGTFDISTPEGRAKAAQAMIDSGRGMAGLLRYQMGGGKQIDTTGWTANEKRDYDSVAQKAARMQQYYEKQAHDDKANSFEAPVLDKDGKPVLDKAGNPMTNFHQIDQRMFEAMQPYWAEEDAKRDEINSRHGRAIADMVKVISPQGVHGTVPRTNLAKALAQGYRQASKTSQQ